MGSTKSVPRGKLESHQAGNTNLADWMKTIFSENTHIPLVSIILPGTHDSATSLLTEKTLRTDFSPSTLIRGIPPTQSIKRFLVDMARTQRPPLGLVAQLQDGVRYFDIRLIWIRGVPYFRHGDIVFDAHVIGEFVAVANFLASHPQEFIFLKFSHFSFIESPTTSTTDDLIASFGRTLISVLGESRVATISDEVTRQTYETQILQRKRNVVIVFDVQGNWVYSSPPQIIPSTNFWVTRYDPSVGNNVQRMIDSGHRAVEEYKSYPSVFKNIQLHYQYDTKTFSMQTLLTGKLKIQSPPNISVIENFVVPLATKNLSLNIITFDYYTPEMTHYIIYANQLRLQAFLNFRN